MKRAAPIFVIVLGALLVLAGAGALYVQTLFQNPAGLPLPASLAGVSLTTKQEGWHALQAFRTLHQQDFLLDAGAIGHYGLEQEATLWVAGAPFEWMARRMVQAMAEKIAQGNSPFSPIRVRTQNSRRIYELEGMGQTHYYYQTGKMVVWLGIDPELAEEGLLQVLKFYP